MNYTRRKIKHRTRIYNNEITRYEAAKEYSINDQTAQGLTWALSGRQSSPVHEQEPKYPYPHTRRSRACRHGGAGVDDKGGINRRSHQSETKKATN